MNEVDGKCPGHNLPSDATPKMRIEACKSCGDGGCGSRETEYVGNKTHGVVFFILSFVAMTVILLLLRATVFAGGV